MSVLYETEKGVFISHPLYVENIFKKISYGGDCISLRFKTDFFEINGPFLRKNEKFKYLEGNSHFKKKRKINHSQFSLKISELAQQVKKELTALIEEGKRLGVFQKKPSEAEDETKCTSEEQKVISLQAETEDGEEVRDLNGSIGKNCSAKLAAEEFYRASWRSKWTSFHGSNNSASAVLKPLHSEEDSLYLFPQNCRFHCCDVRDINDHVEGKFDCVVVDPPWWNKFIRRKNAKCVEAGYQMMTNEELASIPLGQLLNPGALVAVWCTNSEMNMETLEKKIFPQWGLDFLGRWFWIKVTKYGEPVCHFYPPPGRQPFEQIVFGKRNVAVILEDVEKIPWEDGKVIASVPSSLHSHKPPLAEVLRPYLKKNPQCLELFARYLLPEWTSIGFEVLKLQHSSLYEEIN